MVNGSKDEKLLAKVTRWILSYSENLQVPDDTLVAFFRDDTHQYVSKIRTVGYYKNKIQQK